MQLYQGQCAGGIYKVHFYNSCCSECYADTSNNLKILLPFPFLVGICSITSSQQSRHSGSIEDCKEKSCSGWKGEDPVFQQNETRREVYVSVFCPIFSPLSQACLYSHSLKHELIPFPSHLKLWFSLFRVSKSQCLRVLFTPCLFPTPIYPVLQKLSLYKSQISSSISYGPVSSNGRFPFISS